EKAAPPRSQAPPGAARPRGSASRRGRARYSVASHPSRQSLASRALPGGAWERERLERRSEPLATGASGQSLRLFLAYGGPPSSGVRMVTKELLRPAALVATARRLLSPRASGMFVNRKRPEASANTVCPPRATRTPGSLRPSTVTAANFV